MGLLTFVGRIVLVVTNIIFLIISLLLIVFGFILKFLHEVIRPYAKDVLKSIEASVKDLGLNSNFNTENFELGSMVSNIAICFIVIGVALLALSVVGCCGSCYGIQTIMLIYAIVLIVLLLAQVLAAILVYRFPDTVKKHSKSTMKKSLDEYQGLDGTTVTSIGWNWCMQQYHCCGVEGYQDFSNQPSWTGSATYLTPIACCKTLPSDTNGRKQCAGDQTDISYNEFSEIEAMSNGKKGCLDEVWEAIIENNKTYFVLGCAFCFSVQAVLIIFAILVYKDRGITGGLI